jgi:SnoaL-like polyketide cyclase
MISYVMAMDEIALEISPAALQSWRLLPQCARDCIGALAQAPNSARLSVAFPRLIRTVVAVVVGESIRVRVQCDGVHEGMWGEIIRPTKRRVTFAEQHEIVATDERIVSHWTTLDLEAILTQLCGSGAIDPDETARLGRPRREGRAAPVLQ